MTDPPSTEPSAVGPNPLLQAQREADELRRQLASVAVAEPMSRRVGRAITQTRAGQVGALAAAVAVVMTAASPIVVAWMDVSKLRGELQETQRDAARARERVDSLERWQLEVGRWRDESGKGATQGALQDDWRDRVLCRTGNKPPWRLELTCPVPKRVDGMRLE